MYSLAFVGMAAFLLALIATPLVRNVSNRLGAVDHPDLERKLHEVAVPRIGGIAIAIAYVGSFALLPVGYAIIGALTDRVGPGMVFLAGGAINVALTLVALAVPGVRRLE